MKLPIYMDNHATTPLDPRVLDAMMPYFTEKFGNAASRNHTFGFDAENAVEVARKQVASLIGADHREIVFTSGATESDNLALKGVASMYREKGNHIITAASEHKAVLDTCKRLEKRASGAQSGTPLGRLQWQLDVLSGWKRAPEDVPALPYDLRRFRRNHEHHTICNAAP